MLETNNAPKTTCDKPLRYELDQILEKCKNCKLCIRECTFLQKFGKPRTIAKNYDFSNNSSSRIAFECSLCKLCTAVCPYGADPSAMFLEMRRYAFNNGFGHFKQHKRLLNFEKRGCSKRYSHFALPSECDTILFPGCALTGSRAVTVRKLFLHLRKRYPNLGLVLDCCTKPSHDLGMHSYFTKKFTEIKEILLNNNIKNVLVACPSCYNIFNSYGAPLNVRTVYEDLAEDDLMINSSIKDLKVSFHDSCTARFAANIQNAVRKIASKAGLDHYEMKYHGEKALCCGEGGAACFIEPKFISNWKSKRRDEMKGQIVLTYCAGCSNFIGTKDTRHILDILFSDQIKKDKNPTVTRAPFTYWQRLKLKKWARKNIATPPNISSKRK